MRYTNLLVAGALAALVSLQPAAANDEASAQADSKLPAIVSLLTDDDRFLAILRCAKNWNAREADTLKPLEEVQPKLFRNSFSVLAARFGVKPEELESLVFTSTAEEGTVVVSLVDRDAARRMIAKAVPQATTKRIGEREVYTSATSPVAATIVAERHVIFGSVKALDQVPTREPAKVSEAARKFLADVDGSSLLAIEFAPSFFGKGGDRSTISGILFEPLSKADRIRIAVDGSRGLTFKIRADCADAASAAACAETLPKLLGRFQIFFAGLEEKLPELLRRKLKDTPRGTEVGAHFERTITAVNKALATATTKVDGTRAETTITVETDHPLVASAVILFSVGFDGSDAPKK